MDTGATLTRDSRLCPKPEGCKGPSGVFQDQAAAAMCPPPIPSGSKSKRLHYLPSFLLILQVFGLNHSSSWRRHSVCQRRGILQHEDTEHEQDPTVESRGQ